MINWQQVCLNLRRHKSLSSIARDLGCDWQHLNRLARGEVQQPRFNTGMALLDLHYDLYPERHDCKLLMRQAL